MQRIALITILCLGLVSCSKSKCWQCTVVSAGVTSTEEICDKTAQDIKELETTPQETKDKDGVVIYTTTYSNCTQQ